MNISGTLNVFRLLHTPTLCLPQASVPTFADIPVPISKLFSRPNVPDPDIKAIILDKDNCFAVPHENEVYKPYQEKFTALRKSLPKDAVLIVSNTAGTSSDPQGTQAALLERNTSIPVLRHGTKKPGCHDEVMAFFRARPDIGVTRPDQIVVVGDRLFTDVMMANMMGAQGVWVRDGVVGRRSLFAKAEFALHGFLTKRGYAPPNPRSNFE